MLPSPVHPFDDDGNPIPHAIQSVDEFLRQGRERCLDEFNRTLRKIALLPWSQSWRAQRMAEEALGIGMYWDKGIGELPSHRRPTAPKSEIEYYIRLPFRWAFQQFRVFWYDRWGSGSWPFPW